LAFRSSDYITIFFGSQSTIFYLNPYCNANIGRTFVEEVDSSPTISPQLAILLAELDELNEEDS
ncbi:MULTISPECIES: hypothetical protein, partial [unclassified Microcoleus]|uniref:hypothetical protein n=1 Tax=unclassified Microcoleus TaxID=2642155 RepID=UPI002FD79B3D